jgi:hypothetical protein
VAKGIAFQHKNRLPTLASANNWQFPKPAKQKNGDIRGYEMPPF